MPWQRLSDRDQGVPPTLVLHEYVEDHLEPPLRSWIYRALKGGGAELVALRLEIRIEYQLVRGDAALFLARETGQYELLDLVDAILACGGPWPAPSPAVRRASEPSGLQQLHVDLITTLSQGSSAWRAKDDWSGLERRVDATTADAAKAASSAAAGQPDAGSAADQVRSAWDALYRLHPDPPGAYRNAIKAVESAAHAVVEPNNASATLGTMLRQLHNNPQRYGLAIPGPDGTGSVEPLIGMLQLLWKGQTSRHGAQTTTRDETWDEARMAVHLAVTLVHWFTTGAVRRAPERAR